VRAVVANLDATWDAFRAEPDELIPFPGGMLALGRFTGTGKGSGASTTTPAGWVLRFDDELVREMRVIGGHDEARRAAGLAEP
jgi:hypothetical protein